MVNIRYGFSIAESLVLNIYGCYKIFYYPVDKASNSRTLYIVIRNQK